MNCPNCSAPITADAVICQACGADIALMTLAVESGLLEAALNGNERISAVRLEVLPGDKLPAKGPGRANNGNFVLSTFAVAAKPAADQVATACSPGRGESLVRGEKSRSDVRIQQARGAAHRKVSRPSARQEGACGSGIACW